MMFLRITAAKCEGFCDPVINSVFFSTNHDYMVVKQFEKQVVKSKHGSTEVSLWGAIPTKESLVATERENPDCDMRLSIAILSGIGQDNRRQKAGNRGLYIHV